MYSHFIGFHFKLWISFGINAILNHHQKQWTARPRCSVAILFLVFRREVTRPVVKLTTMQRPQPSTSGRRRPNAPLLTITQDTFNEAVKENMQLFDLTLEQSIKESIEQFKSQGTNLVGIITEPTCIFGKDPFKNVEMIFNKSLPYQKRIDELFKLTSALNKDVGYKIYCKEHGIYTRVVENLLKGYVSHSRSLERAFQEFLLAMITGYPDIVDEDGIGYFLFLLKGFEHDVVYALRFMTVACTLHDGNKNILLPQILIRITEIIDETNRNKDVIKNLAKLVAALTKNDDIRVPVPNTYENTVKLANAVLKPLLNVLPDMLKTDLPTLHYLLVALKSLSVNAEICAIQKEMGVVPTVMNILKMSSTIKADKDRELVKRSCFIYISALTSDDDMKNEVMKLNLADEISTSLHQYFKNRHHAYACLKLISKITLRSPENSVVLFNLGLADLIIRVMRTHSTEKDIQTTGCWCIRNMASRNANYHKLFINAGAEALLNRLKKNIPEIHYDANFALRELGFHVDALEPWTGEKGDKLKQ